MKKCPVCPSTRLNKERMANGLMQITCLNCGYVYKEQAQMLVSKNWGRKDDESKRI